MTELGRVLSCAALAVSLGAGCADAHPLDELPPTVPFGENLNLFLEEEGLLCGGTLPYLDRYVGVLQDMHGVAGERLDYYWYPNDSGPAASVCRGAQACALEAVVVTPRMPHEHEVVHGVRWKSGLAQEALEEGIAELWGDASNRESGMLLPVTDAFEVSAGSAELPFAYYPAVGSFAAYLQTEYGTDSLLELGRVSRYDDDFAATDALFQGALGTSLSEAIEDHASQGWDCPRSEYRDDSPSCEAAERIDCGAADADGVVRLELEVGCESDRAIGTRDGGFRVEFAIASADSRRITIDVESDATEGVSLSLRACAAGCDTALYPLLFGFEFDVEVDAGLSLLRFESPGYLESARANLSIRGLCD